MIVLIWRNVLCSIVCQKSTMHTQIDSINFWETLMFICMPKITLTFTSSLRYYILKNPAIWLADSIFVPNSRIRVLPDMGLVLKYQYFYFRLFLGKINDKISNKYITTFYGALLGLFCPNFGKNEFSWKKSSLSC